MTLPPNKNKVTYAPRTGRTQTILHDSNAAIRRTEFIIPIKTGRGQNDREHHMARYRRTSGEREAACLLTRTQIHRNALPCVVTLTRISAGTLDAHDNLKGSLKSILDGIADGLEIKDNDPRVTWRYAQQKCTRGYFGIRVRIET